MEEPQPNVGALSLLEELRFGLTDAKHHRIAKLTTVAFGLGIKLESRMRRNNVILSLLFILAGCLPTTQSDGYKYQTDIESLYNAVQSIAQDLVDQTEGYKLEIRSFDAYTNLVIGFSAPQSRVDIPFSINGVPGGNIPVSLSGRGGEITSIFTATANDEAAVDFSIRDPNRPRRTSEGSFYQDRVRDAGRPFVEEIIRRLDAQFKRL